MLDLSRGVGNQADSPSLPILLLKINPDFSQESPVAIGQDKPKSESIQVLSNKGFRIVKKDVSNAQGDRKLSQRCHTGKSSRNPQRSLHRLTKSFDFSVDLFAKAVGEQVCFCPKSNQGQSQELISPLLSWAWAKALAIDPY